MDYSRSACPGPISCWSQGLGLSVLVVKGLVLMLESNVLGLGEAVLSQGGLLRGCLRKGQPPFFFR